MNKPWIIWSLSVFCAVLVFGAMGVITQHTLGLEKDRAQAEARAELEERIRLSLWRMDTAAAGVLAEENNRPAWHFRDVRFTKRDHLTPLNLNVPEKIKLHFEVKGNSLSTPQVNRWSEAAGDGFLNPSQIERGSELSRKKEEDWGYFQNLLLNDQDYSGWQSKGNMQNDRAGANLDLLREIVSRDEVEMMLPPRDKNAVKQAVQQRTANPNRDVRSQSDYQENYSVAEKNKRQEIVQKSVNNSSVNKKWAMPEMKKPAVKKAVDAKESGVSEPSLTVNDSGSVESKFPTDSESLVSGYLSRLRPVWLGGDLILVRGLQDSRGKKLQGVWLDTEKLKVSLLGDIVDLLPNARLEPATQSLPIILEGQVDPNASDPMVLAALPWRLIPGEVATVEPVGWTPMRKTLGLAWMGVLLAALAAGILLRGVVKLSERRAAFVSSVTHELRTPLTTFGLYSDMLAEGMVKDEEKQKDYLQTLRKESTRLTHLVENVLAYSRIERGSARARVEKVKIGAMIDRIDDRLRSRAEEAGMELNCRVLPEVADREIHVDTTAVEQILFNLVDNASKYASGKNDGKVIELRVLEKFKGIAFHVCDQGPGIAKSEHRKLFRAFHKSAQEAAHSKPGVGLGLALCRRLARALGGDLRILKQKKGSCFEFSLRF